MVDVPDSFADFLRRLDTFADSLSWISSTTMVGCKASDNNQRL